MDQSSKRLPAKNIYCINLPVFDCPKFQSYPFYLYRSILGEDLKNDESLSMKKRKKSPFTFRSGMVDDSKLF